MTLVSSDERSVIMTAPRRSEPRRVLMCSPESFDVAYAINPHMRDENGDLQRVDAHAARAQWEALRRAYGSLGLAVDVIPGVPGLPDMVFAANQTLPFRTKTGSPAVLLSNMHHEERRPEVAHFAAWFKARGFDVRSLPREAVGDFEGNGDVLWFPGREVVFGGFGYRTSRSALASIADVIERPLIPLELVDPRFYHLDTCLCPLDSSRALAVRDAFTAASWAVLEACFETLIEPPLNECAASFACNGHCPDGQNVVIDLSATATIARLRGLGFTPHPVDTSEFRKSGGSVFCLKMMFD